MNHVQLDKIDPKFRHLADLLLFSNRLDIDIVNFSKLLYDNYPIHSEYLQIQFKKSCEIFWEDSEKYWINRISFLYSLNNKPISKGIERHLERRMFSLVRNKRDISYKHDLAYIQFVALCKVKHERKESLLSVRNYLTELPSHVRTDKLIKIIDSFVPIIFESIDEYAEVISSKIIHSTRNFEILQALEKQNLSINRKPLVKLAKEIMLERSRSQKNILAFFSLINDQEILQQLRSEYKVDYRPVLLEFLSNCDYQTLEEFHLRNIKNIIFLDSVIADDLALIYAKKLYARKISHKRANADRLIRLIQNFSEISSKKILAYLSSNNKMSDIKYIIAAFPNLKKLAAFI